MEIAMKPFISDITGRLLPWRVLPLRSRQMLPGATLYIIEEPQIHWRCDSFESPALSVSLHDIIVTSATPLVRKEATGRWRIEVSLLGEVPVLDRNGDPTLLRAGQYQIANYTEHIAEWPNQTPIHFFEADYEANWYNHWPLAPKIKASVIRELTDKMWRCLQRLFHSRLPSNLRPLQFELCVKEFMLLHLAASRDGISDEIQDTVMAKTHVADKLIERDLMGYVSVEQLASVVGLSKSQLKRGFKKLFGCGIFERVTIHRLAEAKRLLEHSDRTMDDIALEVGYSRRNSFSAAFRRALGVSPQAYRRQFGKQPVA